MKSTYKYASPAMKKVFDAMEEFCKYAKENPAEVRRDLNVAFAPLEQGGSPGRIAAVKKLKQNFSEMVEFAINDDGETR